LCSFSSFAERSVQGLISMILVYIVKLLFGLI